jgi:valyl-tRNA synthetase
VVEDLTTLGLLEKMEPHQHAIGVCSRCETVVEPMLSYQWFVRVKPLADEALKAVRDGRTTFHPKRWENTYFSWMENVYDWCISRQLWWGHRIPAYWCERCGEMIVAAERPAACVKCSGSDLRQEDDVLDTWFSSALWPFSTLGWPDQTPELARYYPTSLLITGFDIIFFWVARMMMMGLKCTGQVPFRDVYITPLVRDQFGKKMTKSRGNVVDPLQIMESYGTDAVRFTLAQLSVQGRDLILSDDRLAASRAFANKVWNAARFVLMNLEGAPQPLPEPEITGLPLAERWILASLNNAITEVSAAIDHYEFNVAALRAYSFIWHEFCDWYIELAKEPLKEGGEWQAAVRWVLVRGFDRLLRLLHPFMPFITEELWQSLRPYIDEPGLAPHLAIARFPVPQANPILSPEEATAMERCIEVTETINSLRSLLGYHPGQRVEASVKFLGGEEATANFRAEFERWKPYAATMAKAASLGLAGPTDNTPDGMASAVLGWCEVAVMAPEGFDFARARAALRKKLDEVSAHHKQHQARLDNPDFVAKAAPEMQERMRQRAQELGEQQELLRKQLRLLEAN